jgi:hypothetical protein
VAVEIELAVLTLMLRMEMRRLMLAVDSPFRSPQLDAATRTGNDCHKRRFHAFPHRKIDSKLTQDLLDRYGVGVLRTHLNERGASRSGPGRMRRLAPVDKKWDDAVRDYRSRVGELPREQNSLRRPPVS